MKTTEQQHNARKREMMEKCFDCYAENGLTGTGIKGHTLSFSVETVLIHCIFLQSEQK